MGTRARSPTSHASASCPECPTRNASRPTKSSMATKVQLSDPSPVSNLTVSPRSSRPRPLHELVPSCQKNKLNPPPPNSPYFHPCAAEMATISLTHPYIPICCHTL